MRTVLVCVRTPIAAQQLTNAAARLGLAAVVRTAVSDPEVMLRLAERPVDVVLADTALTRPDSAGFVRRVLARAPQAAVLLLGTEESEAAAATISAGARGLIQGADHDLTSAVAKALLLLAAPGRSARHRVADPARDTAAVGAPPRPGRPPTPGWSPPPADGTPGAPSGGAGQRGDDEGGGEPEGTPAEAAPA
ncbi:helix-turn-helix transcriptional regulator, partial [Micromonospora humida]|uniref:helix-turn-helix transcriptional regulator n=1 Tax=Micromonospora humida TaxID=2809018 RepID=UPI0034464727